MSTTPIETWKASLSRSLFSILIPTRNEPLIEPLVEEVHRVLGEVEHEVIVVDRRDYPPTLADARVVIQQSKGSRKGDRGRTSRSKERVGCRDEW